MPVEIRRFDEGFCPPRLPRKYASQPTPPILFGLSKRGKPNARTGFSRGGSTAWAGGDHRNCLESAESACEIAHHSDTPSMSLLCDSMSKAGAICFKQVRTAC